MRRDLIILFDYRTTGLAFVATCALIAVTAPAPARLVRQTAPATCTLGQPGIRITVTGLRDRTGMLRLELYPAVEGDFLQDDEALLRAGKVFRRIAVLIPATGSVGLCVATPGPGRYAMVVIHNRHGASKFSVARDSVGVPGQANVGRSRPKLAQATVTVADGISNVVARMQYLRGLGGFAPMQS